MNDQPDFLIVGGGLCGSYLAAELVQRFGYRVTILETGSLSTRNIQRQPAKWIRMLGGDQDHDLVTERVGGLAGRRLRWPRGKGLGGSQRINAMIWTPPTDRDLAMLHAAGGDTWSPQKVRAAFARVEKIVQPEAARYVSEASTRFLTAAQNWSRGQSSQAEPVLFRRTNRQGKRWTSADRLELVDKTRLSLLKCRVDQILFRDDRASAVGVQTESGTQHLEARHGIILCGGAIATPAILHRSGIGDAAMLRDAGVQCRLDSPGVGQNLKDHLIYPVVFALPDEQRFPRQFSTRHLAQFQSIGRGPIVSNLAEAGGLFDDTSIQLHVTPTHYLTYPSKKAVAAMTIGVNATRPVSRGRVTTTPRGVSIQPNYLTARSDMDTMLRGVAVARQIAARDPMAEWIARELIPGTRRDSTPTLAASIARYSQTLYHPVGTCAFGASRESPVDTQLRVRGVNGLWVVDASVLPNITQTNPSGTLLALCDIAAQKISELG